MDKEYTVLVEAANGSRYAVQARKSRMQRVLGQLTKSAVKAWLNEVSRQQSLGVKGMTCVWQVRSTLLQCSFAAPESKFCHLFTLVMGRRCAEWSQAEGHSESTMPALLSRRLHYRTYIPVEQRFACIC